MESVECFQKSLLWNLASQNFKAKKDLSGHLGQPPHHSARHH